MKGTFAYSLDRQTFTGIFNTREEAFHAGCYAAERLHDTINHLNRSRTHCLIHFRHDGTGKGLPGRRC